MKLVYFAVLLLAACAPATDCIDDTAFTATVSALAKGPMLEVQPERGRALNVMSSEETRVTSDSGETLTLADLTLGTNIYVRGSLEGKDVTALEVRVLNR